MICFEEIENSKGKNLNTKPGVYKVYIENELVYIGYSNNIKRRVYNEGIRASRLLDSQKINSKVHPAMQWLGRYIRNQKSGLFSIVYFEINYFSLEKDAKDQETSEIDNYSKKHFCVPKFNGSITSEL